MAKPTLEECISKLADVLKTLDNYDLIPVVITASAGVILVVVMLLALRRVVTIQKEAIDALKTIITKQDNLVGEIRKNADDRRSLFNGQVQFHKDIIDTQKARSDALKAFYEDIRNSTRHKLSPETGTMRP